MNRGSALTQEEREKAKILAASGRSSNYIAKGMGRSHHTLAKFLSRPKSAGKLRSNARNLRRCSIPLPTGFLAP